MRVGLSLIKAVDFLAPGLNQEERPGFFARGSHTRENDKPRERVFILSFPRVAAARGIPFLLSLPMKIDSL
jgi:hypothetical protein